MKKATKTYAKMLFNLLKKHYPHAHMILTWENNWELLVSIILSAQCTDSMVNKVTANIFPKYKKKRPALQKWYDTYTKIILLPLDQIVEIVNFAFFPTKELEQDIKSTGFYHNKAKNIKLAARVLLTTYHGIPPKTIRELITIPGVGRKTANVFLGNAYGIIEGIAVDTHVKKQSLILGLTKEKNPEKIEQDLMSLFDKKDWFSLTYFLIAHGRNMRKKEKERKNCGRKECLLCKN